MGEWSQGERRRPHHSPLTTHQVKILDFGLAILTVERRDGLTAEHAIMGTPEYMAPEQAENSHTADIRADIYSLGCTLYVLLTGDVPYPAETPLLKILAHRDRPLPSIQKARPDVPPELAAVLARMMAKKPSERYQTPAEVAAALAPFVVQASSLPREKAGWKPAPQRLLLAASFLAALLLAGGVVYRIQTDKGELVITTESEDVKVVITQSGKLVDVIDTETDKQIRLTLRSGEYELELKDAPEGLKLDVEKATLRRGKETLARIERVAEEQVPAKTARETGREVFRQRHNSQPNLTLELSRDGSRLLSEHWGDLSIIWEVASGKIVQELRGSWARFTVDGKQIVTGNYAREESHWVHIYDSDNGKLLRKYCQHPNKLWGLSVNADGRTFITYDGRVDRMWNLETGELLHTWSANERGPESIYQSGFKEADTFETRTGIQVAYVLPGGRGVMAPPQGRTFPIYETKSGRLVHKASLEGRGDIQSYTSGRGRGNRLVVLLTDGTVCVLDLISGKEVARFSAKNFQPTCVAVSADGRFVAACATQENSDLVVWRVPDPPATKDKP